MIIAIALGAIAWLLWLALSPLPTPRGYPVEVDKCAIWREIRARRK